MGCCCGHTEEEGTTVHSPVPAPAKDVFEDNRKCRDVLFLLLFIAFWAGMFYVGGTAFEKGDPNRIIYGLDSQGNLCGQKNAGVNGTAGPDFTGQKKLYWLDYRDIVEGNLTHSKRVCMADCPNNSTEFVCAYNSRYQTDYFDSLTIAAKLKSAAGLGPCYPVLLPTVPVVNKCFPQPPPSLTAFVEGAVNASAAAPAATVAANSTVTFQYVASMAAQLSGNKLQAYISDLIKAWLVVLVCGVGGGLLFSVLWIAILRFCAGVMAWTSILAVNVALIGVTLFCYAKAGKISGQAIARQLGSLPAILDPAEQDKKVFAIVAYVMTGVCCVMLGITLLLFRRIRIAVACLQVGSQAVAAMPLLMLFPLLPFVLLVALCVYWVAVAGYLYSAGDIVHSADGSYSIEWNDTLRYMALYHLFGLLWTWQFIAGLGYMVVAGAVARFYWCRGDRSRVPRWPVATALKRTLVFYLGSIAFGSLIVAIVQFFRLVLEWVDRKARAVSGGESAWLKAVLGCLRCVLWVVEQVVKFINKNAYIMVAVKGTGYCDSAGRAVTLMVGNSLRVAAVNTVGASLLWVGKVAVAALCGGFAFLMCDLPQYAQPSRTTYLSSPLFPVLFAAVFAYFIAAVFMNTYEMAIDTILLCFCEDCERNDGAAQYAPPLLLSALGKAVHKETSVVPTVAPVQQLQPLPPDEYNYSPSSPGPLQAYPPAVMQQGWVAGPHGSSMSAPHRVPPQQGVHGYTR